MREIMLFGGEVVQVDDEDFEGLTTHKWSCLRGKGATYYACSCKRVNDTNTHIGRYDTKEAAAHAYDNMARIHFGEFAHLNFGETATDEDIR